MATPIYATDLVDISTAESTTNFTAIGGGGAITAETDFFIQGSFCISKATQASWDSSGTPIGGVLYNYGSGVTIPSPGGFFVWIYWWGPGVLATFASGGARLSVGSSTVDFAEWNVKGVDDWIFGGWECAVVDPAWGTADRTVGTPSGTRQYFGWEANVAATTQIGKGNPYGCDVIRYGRGELSCINGDVTNGYASFGGSSPDAGAAAYDNNNARRWGLLTPRDGAYFMQGLFLMGTAATAVDFRDSNRVIFVKNTRRVVSTFNGFEVRNATSNVEWTNVSVQALGTVSRGFFTVTAGVVTLDTCTFTDMDTFTFLASTSALNCTFRRTNAITAPGSNMTGSTIDTPTVAADTGAFVWNVATNPDGLLDNMTFSKGTNAHHAIDFGTAVTANITLRGCEFTGFGSTGDSNDSTVRFLATTGSLTLSLVGCTVNGSPATTGNFSVDDAAGIVVTLSISPVTVTVTTKDINGDPVGSANVFLKAASGGSGILPVSATVNSITRVNATTAEATHAAVHNMSTGDKVYIKGADQAAYNGVFVITLVGVASPTTMYRYTTLSDPVVNATGTLTATFVFLKDTTNASTGVLSMSRVITADQNVTGWARKHSTPPNYTPPNYKTSNITGTVLSSANFSATVLLILDD